MLRKTCHESLQGHFLLPWVDKILSLVITQSLFCHVMSIACDRPVQGHLLLPWVEYTLPLVIIRSLFITTGRENLATGHYTITFYCHGLRKLVMGHEKITFYCHEMSIPCHESLQCHFLLPWVKKHLLLVITRSLFNTTA